MSMRLFRIGVLLTVLLSPLVWWTYTFFVDPDIESLTTGVTSESGAWIVSPQWKMWGDGVIFPPTRYRLLLPDLDAVPKTGTIDIFAPGEFRVAVNRRTRFDSRSITRSWRSPVRLDLASWLDTGVNEILIEVSNQHGPTPLRVAGTLSSADGEMSFPVATGDADWQAAFGNRRWSNSALAGHGETSRRGPTHQWAKPVGYFALLAAALLIAGIGWTRGRFTDEAEAKTESSLLRRHGVELLVLAVIIAANLWNSSNFYYRTSQLDWGGHTDHIRYAATTLRPALAHEGWQMYQPPFYYWAASLPFLAGGGEGDLDTGYRYVQLFGGLVGSLHMLVAFLVLARFGPASVVARSLALLAIGLTPMTLTTNAMITNEPTAGLMGALPIAALLFLLTRSRISIPGGAVLGLLAGLALLTKFSGLMVVATIGVALGTRLLIAVGRRERLNMALTLAAFFAVTLVVAGPYYARNVEVYGEPFVGNWDEASRHAYEQEPGYRTLRFYSTFGEVFLYRPVRAPWSSLWDGLYASTWGEVHGNWISYRKWDVLEKQMRIFALALIPTLAALAGFLRAIPRAASSDPSTVGDLALVTVTVFSIVSVAVFVVTVPFHSTVKAFFLLHLLVPMALFMAHGYERLASGLGRARHLLPIAGVAQALLILDLYVRNT